MMELPKELLEKLQEAEGDVAACKLLAENGIDPEEFEKSLPDSLLEKITAGADEEKPDLYCPYCGNADRDEMSLQVWMSIFIYPSGTSQYRCKKCDQYFRHAWF